jgi:hypothetical protein
MSDIPVGGPQPWYRQRWPWFLISLPATAVVAGFITLYLAVRSDDGVVAEDYYTKGLAINQVLDRQERAKQLGLSADLQQQEGGKLVLTLVSERELALPEQIRLALVNPVRAGLDKVIPLHRSGLQYIGTYPAVPNGRWKLVLEDEGGIWQLFSETQLPLAKAITLKP